METKLGSQRDFVQRFADMISNTVDADVIIVDNSLNMIGSAFRYFSLYNAIEEHSILSDVLLRKETVIVRDKSELASCRACEQFDACKMIGLVGVPIFYNRYVIGAIALTLPQHRVNTLFQTLDTSVEFLENMAELLAGKVRTSEENQALTRLVAERETLMDLLNDAVVYTDIFGNMIHTNKQFARIFSVKGNQVGKRIQDLIPHKIFSEYFEETAELRGERFYIEDGGVSFSGIVSSKRVRINGSEFGVMFCLRTLKDIVQDSNLSQLGSMVTLKWASWALPRETLEECQSLAVTPYHILLEGGNKNLNEMAAKGIVNYSERSVNGLKKICCDNMYRNLLETFLFDEFGELTMSDQGTVLIHDIENLPFYLQERLLKFLKTGRLAVTSGSGVYADVRFIFSTTKDLGEMVEKGYFLEELYLMICEHRIKIPKIQEDQKVFRSMAESAVEFYKKKYRKRLLTLSEDAVAFLWNYKWGEQLNLLESKLETIVRRNEGPVTAEILKEMGIFPEPGNNDLSLSTLEKERIRELLKGGHTKTEIARKLGIGRATLYRKMTEYGFS